MTVDVILPSTNCTLVFATALAIETSVACEEKNFDAVVVADSRVAAVLLELSSPFAKNWVRAVDTPASDAESAIESSLDLAL